MALPPEEGLSTMNDNITNDELLDYLRNELDSEKRKYIAAQLYQDIELRDRFKDIQRLESVIRENYHNPTVNISAETEVNMLTIISEAITTILSEKPVSLTPVKDALQEFKVEETPKVGIKKYLQPLVWAAAILVVALIGLNLMQDNPVNNTNYVIRSAPFTQMEIEPEVKIKKFVVPELPEIGPIVIDSTDDRDEDNEIIPKESIKKPIDSKLKPNIPDLDSRKRWENDPFLRGFSKGVKEKEQVVVPKSRLPGDVNQDGVVDNQDLEMLKWKFLIDIPSRNHKKFGYNDDVDGDGKVNIKDINELSRMLEEK